MRHYHLAVPSLSQLPAQSVSLVVVDLVVGDEVTIIIIIIIITSQTDLFQNINSKMQNRVLFLLVFSVISTSVFSLVSSSVPLPRDIKDIFDQVEMTNYLEIFS